ncbi:MAG: FAD-dependent oxidoreductase, partial [Treponema sp.]|nr:FAD-dependent oxidoreductase [Treponema sp.]
TQITNITWDGLNDSAGLGGAAVPLLRDKILEAQSTGVDSISGATVTSVGFKAAVAAALEEAGASLAFTSKPKDPVKVTKTVEAGVLVIGSGIAGLSAAYQAKTDRTDATVIVIEKQEIIGGTTKTSAGVVYAALDDSQAEADALADYYMERAQGYANRDLVQFFANNSYETLEFLGITPTGFAMSSGTSSAARMRMSAGGNGLVQMLYGKATEAGVTVMTGVKATELIKNSAGRVTGVKAESKAINYTFNVSGGVVVATGGFDSDREGLMQEHNPDSMYDIPQSNHGNVGEGIKMGVAVGADTVFKGGKIGWVGIDPSLGEASHYYSAIIDDKGNLLVLNNLPASVAGTNNAGKLHPALTAVNYETHRDDYAVVHRRMLDARKAAGGTLGFWSLTNTAPMYPEPYAYTSSTIAGLANLIDIDVEKLQAAFASGQEISNMMGPSANLTDEEGTVPFTATKAVPSSIGSMGGLKINTSAQVLSAGDTSKTPIAKGQPIPGLYAAGETANGDLFYLEYPGSGTSLSVGATFGRFAGKNAAAEVPPSAWSF